MAKKLIYKVEVDTSKASTDLNDLGNQLDEIQEKSKVDIAIDNANAVKSVGDLRKAYKELINIQTEYGEGTEEFQKAAQAAGGLKDRLDAVKESVNSFSASPIENVANSFKDLKSKLFALDFEGAKQSFNNLSTNVVDLGKSMLGIGTSASAASVGVKVLTAALAATGITLLVGAVVALINSFDSLKNSGGAIGAVFTKVGETIQLVKDAVVDLADSWGLVDKSATESAREQQRVAQETADKINEIRKKLYNDGLSDLDKAIRDEKALRQQEFTVFISDLNDRKLSRQEEYSENEKFLEESERRIQAIRDKFAKEEKDKVSKEAADKAKIEKESADKRIDSFKAITEEAIDSEDEYAKAQAARIAYTEGLESAAYDAQLKRIQDENAAFMKSEDEKTAAALAKIDNQKIIDEQENQRQIDAAWATADSIAMIYSAEGPMGMAVSNFTTTLGNTAASINEMVLSGTATALDTVAASLELANNLIGSIGGILQAQSDERITKIQETEAVQIASLQKQRDAGIITEDQLTKGISNIQRNARAQEYKEKKKAFEQNKAIQIVQAVIGTAQAVITALSGGPIVGPIMAAIAAAAGAAQIGIISSQSFPSGGSAGSGSVSAPATSSPPSLPDAGNNGPNINFAAAGSGSTLNTVGNQMQPIIVNSTVTVSETEITGVQGQVQMYEANATLGGG